MPIPLAIGAAREGSLAPSAPKKEEKSGPAARCDLFLNFAHACLARATPAARSSSARGKHPAGAAEHGIKGESSNCTHVRALCHAIK